MNRDGLLPCFLREQAERQPHGEAVLHAGESVTFSQLDQRVRRIQAGLRKQCGVKAESRLALWMKPGADWVSLLVACMREGIELCPLNLRLPPSLITERLEALSTDALVFDDPLSWMPPVPGFAFKDLYGEGSVDGEALIDIHVAGTGCFTSGSSGHATFIEHRWRHHLASARAALEGAPLTLGDRWLVSLPLYHVGGMAVIFRCLMSGATLCFPGEGEVGDELSRLRPTHVSWVPTQLKRYLEQPELREFDSNWKRILLGGAAAPESLIEEALSRDLPVAVSYGMTETASQIACTPPGELPQGSGRLLSHARVKISDRGEILVQAESVPGELTRQGWLHTGDRGRLEGDILFVEGRMDRLFISGGENIQPEMIENELLRCIGCGQAVVVPLNDPEFGERPAAWVDTEVTDDKVKSWTRALRQRLPGYMLPAAYRELPRDDALKPDLAALTRTMSAEQPHIPAP